MVVNCTWVHAWHRMDHVSWSLGPFSKNHLLKVGLTQNQETMALQTLKTVDLFYFYHVWGPAWMEIHCYRSWLKARHIWLHTILEVPWPHHMILEVCWDGLWTLSIGLSHFHGDGSWLMCEVALMFATNPLGDHCIPRPTTTSHMRLKAHDHCILRSLIGRKGWEHPSSLPTRRWSLEVPKNFSWMKGLRYRKLYMDCFLIEYI
jgi:hypothetical protein